MPDPPENSALQTGDLTIYPSSGQVEIQGHIVRLGLVNMQVLLTLLENAGEVVSRADLFDRVWKNQVVSDDSLTRCISELRTQLGQHSCHSSLIETLPKRGYRWVLGVDYEIEAEMQDAAQRSGANRGRIKRASVVVSFGLVLLLLFTMLVLWLIDLSLRPEQARIALIPVYTGQPGQVSLAADLDDMLREELLATDNLRFLARSAMTGGQQSNIPYYSRDIGVQWIIEGTMREKQGRIRVTLSLVDARTALVTYTLIRDVGSDPRQMGRLSSTFVDEVSRILRMDG